MVSSETVNTSAHGIGLRMKLPAGRTKTYRIGLISIRLLKTHGMKKPDRLRLSRRNVVAKQGTDS